MSECFPKSKDLGGRVKVEIDLSNYTTKADLKNKQVLIHQNLVKRLG